MGFTRDGTLFYRQQIDQRDAFEVDIDALTRKANGVPRRITERFVHSSGSPVWSGDGQLLAFTARRGQSALTESGDSLIVVKEIASDREREFPIFAQQVYWDSLRWFPDNKSILFVNTSSGGRQFRRLEIGSGQVRTLFETPYSNVLASFISPDGKSILYTLSSGPARTDKQVMRYDLETGEHTPVYVHRIDGATGPPAYQGFSVSPDGKQMAFLQNVTDSDGNVNWQVMLASLAGGEPRLLWRSTNRFSISPGDVGCGGSRRIRDGGGWLLRGSQGNLVRARGRYSATQHRCCDDRIASLLGAAERSAHWSDGR